MLKTNENNPAQPAIPLIALGALMGYIKNPIGFLVGTILELPRFKKQIPPKFPQEFVKAVALQTCMYIRLKEKIGPDSAFEVIRAMSLPGGLALTQANFRVVGIPRTFENLVTVQQRTNKEGNTRWNQMEIIEQSERKYEFRITYCMFYDFYTQMGVPELTTIACSFDNAIFNSYLPEEVTFHRNGIGNRISDGAAACHFVLEHHSE